MNSTEPDQEEQDTPSAVPGEMPPQGESQGDAPRPIFGWLKGTVECYGDIVGPTGEVWKADT